MALWFHLILRLECVLRGPGCYVGGCCTHRGVGEHTGGKFFLCLLETGTGPAVNGVDLRKKPEVLQRNHKRLHQTGSAPKIAAQSLPALPTHLLKHDDAHDCRCGEEQSDYNH